VVGVDEVGRGALAGPVCVGAVGVRPGVGAAPAGLDDSKNLTPAARAALLDPIRAWAGAAALGWASAAEIDALGIVPALALAGRRALEALGEPGGIVLLDGPHDYLTPRQPTLFETDPANAPEAGPAAPAWPWRVIAEAKADGRRAAVAAASVLAKCARDAVMANLGVTCPEYGWAENKGYGTAGHRAAIHRHGVRPEHRTTWNLGA
jgi:ribonuclease HII